MLNLNISRRYFKRTCFLRNEIFFLFIFKKTKKSITKRSLLVVGLACSMLKVKQSAYLKGQGSRRDKIGPVTKINEIWQYCMCMSSVTENDSF